MCHFASKYSWALLFETSRHSIILYYLARDLFLSILLPLSIHLSFSFFLFFARFLPSLYARIIYQFVIKIDSRRYSSGEMFAKCDAGDRKTQRGQFCMNARIDAGVSCGRWRTVISVANLTFSLPPPSLSFLVFCETVRGSETRWDDTSQLLKQHTHIHLVTDARDLTFRLVYTVQEIKRGNQAATKSSLYYLLT